MTEYDKLKAQRDDIEGRQRIRAGAMLQRLSGSGEITTDKFSETQSLNALWIAGLCEKHLRPGSDGAYNTWSINAAGKAAALK